MRRGGWRIFWPLIGSRTSGVCWTARMPIWYTTPLWRFRSWGTGESVVRFARQCETNRRYSHRVLLELLQAYRGDRAELVRQLHENCNEYIQATAYKAYTADCLEELAPLYVEAMGSRDTNLKIAGVKALAQLGKPEYEQKMTIALNDKNWIVRLAAVSGLEKIGTETALEALVGAAQDEEWWVRNAAARPLSTSISLWCTSRRCSAATTSTRWTP